ncbi:ribonuclease P protein component [Candidatus Gottesmanbacteria bacterium]|nr:ribonuclease P protein component [Candidatus Gottesmanbacteria bacterium]
MLAKKNRLSLTTGYQKLKTSGKWLNRSFFNLLYSDKFPSNNPHVAIVVGNKVSPLATKRNRLKRLISEAIRPFLSSLPENFTLAIFAKKEINDKNLGEIKTELEGVVKQFNNETKN